MIQQAQSWYHLFMQNGCDVYKAVYVVFYSENVYIHLSAPHPPMLHDIYKQLVLNNFITSNLPCQMTSLKHFADERVLQLNPVLKCISLNARLFFFFTVFLIWRTFCYTYRRIYRLHLLRESLMVKTARTVLLFGYQSTSS